MSEAHLKKGLLWLDQATRDIRLNEVFGLPPLHAAYLGRGKRMLATVMNGYVHLLGMHVVPPEQSSVHRVQSGEPVPLLPSSRARGGVLLSNTVQAWGSTPGKMTVYLTPALSPGEVLLDDGQPANPLLRFATHLATDMGERLMGGRPETASQDDFQGARLAILDPSRVWLREHPSAQQPRGIPPVWAVYLDPGESLVPVGTVPHYQG